MKPISNRQEKNINKLFIISITILILAMIVNIIF